MSTGPPTCSAASPGRALGRDDAEPTVDAACDVLRRLRRLDPGGMVRHTPADLLAHGRQVARLVGHIAPGTTGRLSTMLDRLERDAAGPGDLVAAHGDFNVGQLLLGHDGGLVLVDTDTLCAASAAYDPASYAANLVAGRPGDLDDARRLLRRFGQQVGEAHGRASDRHLSTGPARLVLGGHGGAPTRPWPAPVQARLAGAHRAPGRRRRATRRRALTRRRRSQSCSTCGPSRRWRVSST